MGPIAHVVVPDVVPPVPTLTDRPRGRRSPRSPRVNLHCYSVTYPLDVISGAYCLGRWALCLCSCALHTHAHGVWGSWQLSTAMVRCPVPDGEGTLLAGWGERGRDQREGYGERDPLARFATDVTAEANTGIALGWVPWNVPRIWNNSA